MKILSTAFCILLHFYCSSQTITKYYDADWIGTTNEKASYYATFIKEGNIYKCTSYYKGSNLVRGRSTYPDTTFASPSGLQMLFSKNGKVEDSAFYADGKISFLYHYYSNGKLAVHNYLPNNSKEPITEAYDEDGKKIKNYVFEKEADFKGGLKAWQAYILKNVSKDFTIKGKDGAVTASVKIQFIIDESGAVIKPKIINSSGYKVIDNDALRVIAESPQWNNAYNITSP
jgi:antitoxin component YwqK of YwqJK toxin-antitoxin module